MNRRSRRPGRSRRPVLSLEGRSRQLVWVIGPDGGLDGGVGAVEYGNGKLPICVAQRFSWSVGQSVGRRPTDFGLAKPGLNTMPDADTG